MPNYVTNRIELQGSQDQIDDLLERIKNDVLGKWTIDFLKLVPRPPELDIEAGSSTYRGMKEYENFLNDYIEENDIKELKIEEIPKAEEDKYLEKHKDIDHEDWDLGRKAMINTEKYGAPTWYEWNIRNWGTKWNACGYDDEYDYSKDEEIVFDTAWSPPHQILEKMASLYPGIQFTHRWADEDVGQNCGACEYRDGKRVKAYIPVDEKEGVTFACSVLGLDPEEIRHSYENGEDLSQ